MHTKTSLMKDLENLSIDRKGTLMVHSSMKAIGEVEGKADTVLDALSEYMQEGLLVLPTHTWSYVNVENPRYNVNESPSCVGILTELFRKRPGVERSWHPTHSVAALGKDAKTFVAGNEQFDTPCARGSSWGRLLDKRAVILFIGVDLTRNTFMHGVEEWMDVPNRITDGHELLYTILPDGTEIPVPSRRHCGESWSDYFWKVEDLLMKNGIMHMGQFGDAEARLCDTAGMTDLLFRMIKVKPNLFSNNEPLEGKMYREFHQIKA